MGEQATQRGWSGAIGGLLLGCAASALAKVGADQAARLGRELTPVGATQAGNAAGSIPAWSGGLAGTGLQLGDDPYAGDRPLYTITAKNLAQYQPLLSVGHQALFRAFPESYAMRVYPTRRSAIFPDWFHAATRRNATTVGLNPDGNGFCCAAQGVPFPLPASGLEVMWNHLTHYNTPGFRGYVVVAATQAGGAYVAERNYLEVSYVYNNPQTRPEQLDNRNLYLMVKTVSPPNKAGEAALIHVPLDRMKLQPLVWIYNAALSRVRRIGEVGYDNPLFDGLITQDQLDMFNGPLDRYTVKLLGKREMLVPYNGYALYDRRLKYRELLRPGHPAQQRARYELHRVWVIEAQLRPGQAHRYRRRLFYLDEDSWTVLMQDIYDERDQFWRFSEAHAITYAGLPLGVNGLQIHYDLQSRRYVAVNLSNEEKKPIDYGWRAEAKYFSPEQLKRFATTRQ